MNFVNFNLREGKQKRDFQKLLDKIATDRRFYQELIANPAECCKKYDLDLPKGLDDLIKYGVLRRKEHRHNALSRLSSAFHSIISLKPPVNTRLDTEKIEYEQPMVFALQACDEICDKAILGLDAFLNFFAKEDVYVTYSYDSSILRPKRVELKEFLKARPILKYVEYWIDDYQAVVHPFNQFPYKLNDVGKEVCKLCDGKHSVDEILHTCQARFDVNSLQIQGDLIRFLCLLLDLDLLEL